MARSSPGSSTQSQRCGVCSTTCRMWWPVRRRSVPRKSRTRCETVGGDFFKSVPADGDGYILSRVIHDWDDDAALKIIHNCRRVVRLDGRLLLVEGVSKPPNEPDPNKFLDVWFISGGGYERSEAEYRA